MLYSVRFGSPSTKMCQTSPVLLTSGENGMTTAGRVSVTLSNRSNSIRVAPWEWIAKLIPSGLTVGPSGSGSPGWMSLIVGMRPPGD